MTLTEYENSGRTYIIAEIAQAHDGSLGILHSLVEAAAETGVDAIKFQMHIAQAESSPLEPFRVPFSYVDRTRFDYWKRMELTREQWGLLKERCDKLGVEFLATPFSNAAVDLLEMLGVTRYKIGSGDANNPLLLKKIINTGKEVIISTGLGTIQELDRTVSLLRDNSVPYGLLQCTSKYPSSAGEVGLGWLAKLRDRYGCPVGLSDHSGTIYAGLGAVALGAVALETHITFDRRMFGPDAPASLTIDELSQLVKGARFLEEARGFGADKDIDPSKMAIRTMFGKALAVNRLVSAGETLRFEDLEGKKPANAGISVADLDRVIGAKLICDKQPWDFLQQEDFE